MSAGTATQTGCIQGQVLLLETTHSNFLFHLHTYFVCLCFLLFVEYIQCWYCRIWCISFMPLNNYSNKKKIHAAIGSRRQLVLCNFCGRLNINSYLHSTSALVMHKSMAGIFFYCFIILTPQYCITIYWEDLRPFVIPSALQEIHS